MTNANAAAEKSAATKNRILDPKQLLRPLSERPYAQDFSGESRTQQQFVGAADINNIVAHFQATGVDPSADRAANQQYGFASSQSFSDAMQNIAEINSAFADLPSEARQGFGNDPARWLDSMATPPPTPDEIVAPEASEEADISKETAEIPEKPKLDST